MLPCLCATYWYASSCTVQWPGFSWDRLIRKFSKNRNKLIAESIDLPPAYELIHSYQEDVLSTANNKDDEPPSYENALKSWYGAT